MADRANYKPHGAIEATPCLTEMTTKLLGLLVPRKTVWEFGSGGSTLWFAKRAKSVVSIEDDPDWYAAVKDALNEQGMEGVDLRLSPTKTLPDTITDEGLYDLVFVDCLTQNERRRSIILGALHVKPGGWLVADDYTFPLTNKEVEKLRAEGWDVTVVSGTKTHPLRKVVVATATAFCRRPGP